MISVRYFARVREALRRERDEIPFPGESVSVADLVGSLRRQDPDGWRRLPDSMRLLYAVNREMAPSTAMVRDGDEVAVFPPVTGG